MKADDEYDERYYREWMHELPPMQHNVRGGWLDVHHNLVPRTSRFYPDARSLLRRAVPISKTGYYSLAPADMLIHSILHGFASGEFLNGFRDILDVHELITDLQDRHEGFWQDFQDRVTELDIGRPAYYALRYAKLFFGTRIPADSLAALSGVVPNALVLVIMDFAVNSMVLRGPQPTMRQRWAGRLLLARSHWIKMPPWMLFKHLARKFSKRRALRADQV
jgi:hypothetical protein